MTLNEFKDIGFNDYLKLDDVIYKFEGQAEIDGCCQMLKCVCHSIDKKNPKFITITKDTITTSSGEIYFNSLDYVIKLSEKEVLEIQLKDAEEQVQKETARVDSIKAKLEELSKPKLKIGGLYSFLIGQTKHVGVLTRIDKYYYYIITSELNRYTFTYGSGPFEYANFREITNPKYSYIGPTILEFMKLNPENFQ